MERKDRLKEAFEYLRNKGEVHTQKDLAERMGATRPNVSGAFKGDIKILTDKFIRRFNDAFDNLFNLDWLLTGNGEMLAVGLTENSGNVTAVYSVPLLPISAQGGSFNEFVIAVKESDCEKIISPIKGAEYAMTVTGDSMEPEYPSGSQILIKRVNERAFIDWGRVYVLDTCNGSVIKRLFPSEDHDKVICKSINPEYPPFEVSLADVYGVYRVLMCMSLK